MGKIYKKKCSKTPTTWGIVQQDSWDSGWQSWRWWRYEQTSSRFHQHAHFELKKTGQKWPKSEFLTRLLNPTRSALVGEAAGLTLVATGTLKLKQPGFSCLSSRKTSNCRLVVDDFRISGQSSISSISLAGFNPSTVFNNLDTSSLSRDLLNLTHLC